MIVDPAIDGAAAASVGRETNMRVETVRAIPLLATLETPS